MSVKNTEAVASVLLSRDDVAKRWRCSTETVKRLDRAGKLRRVFLGGGRIVRYRVEDVEALEQIAPEAEAAAGAGKVSSCGRAA